MIQLSNEAAAVIRDAAVEQIKEFKLDDLLEGKNSEFLADFEKCTKDMFAELIQQTIAAARDGAKSAVVEHEPRIDQVKVVAASDREAYDRALISQAVQRSADAFGETIMQYAERTDALAAKLLKAMDQKIDLYENAIKSKDSQSAKSNEEYQATIRGLAGNLDEMGKALKSQQDALNKLIKNDVESRRKEAKEAKDARTEVVTMTEVDGEYIIKRGAK